MPTDPLKDKGFALSAATLGLFYLAIVWLVRQSLGTDAAKAATIALSALAVAIFKRYEALRFTPNDAAEPRIVSVPPLRSPYVLTLTLAFLGLLFFGGTIHGTVTSQLNVRPSSSIWLYTLTAGGMLGYGAGGFLSGRTAPLPKYSYALLAVTLCILIDAAFVWYLSYRRGVRIDSALSLWTLVLAPVAAFLGVRLGLKPRFATQPTAASP
jgi:hypothetical protein